MLFFTNTGRVYKMKAYNVPEATRTSKGIPMVNLLTLKENETIEAMTTLRNLKDNENYLLFVTKKGVVKRTCLNNFQNIMKGGIRAINLREGDSILDVVVTNGSNKVILGASNGKSITFDENEIRDMGRSASGVRGMNLSSGEEIVGVSVINSDNDLILALSANGFGKLTASDAYRVQSRGGKGIITLKTTEKNGNLIDLAAVTKDLDLILTTNKGISIRVHISDISISGRNSQGVKIVKLRDNQYITNTAIVPHEEDTIDEKENNNTEE
jgi:DNA gyrase subunit A